MRLAVYGWVAQHAGSGPSAHYLLVKELLARGVEIDFYANKFHNPCPPGLDGPNFSYVGFTPPSIEQRMPAPVERWFGWILSPVMRAAWRRTFQPVAEERHRKRPYDVLLSLDTPPPFDLPGTATVTWVPGPPQTELETLLRLRRQVSAVSGMPFWLAFIAYYKYSNFVERNLLDTADEIICGSEWSRRAVVAGGFAADHVHAIPFAIDLEAFSPRPGAGADLEHPVVLCLGRLDPRKRLDLLANAFSIVLDSLPDARLRVVGRQGYARKQVDVLERAEPRERIEYRPAVPRQQVPDLIREAAVLVQTSESENFGSSVAEALASGVPVVVGRTNGTAQYIDENSAVFDTYDPQHVASAILAVVRRRRARPIDVSASTRAAAERHFRVGTVCDSLLGVIEAANRRQR